MKKKPIDFATFKKIQKMPLNIFNKWLIDLCNTCYDDGVKSVQTENAVELTDNQLLGILLSVKGIGKNRAQEVLNKILEETDGNET